MLWGYGICPAKDLMIGHVQVVPHGHAHRQLCHRRLLPVRLPGIQVPFQLSHPLCSPSPMAPVTDLWMRH